MYSDLARSVLIVDEEELDAEIRRMRERYPEAGIRELTDRLIVRAAVKCALVGAVAAIPASFIPVLPVAADVSFQVRSLNGLALAVAHANRRRTTPVDRAAAAVGALALAGAARVFRRGFLRGARRSLAKNSPRLVPFAGALAGAASGALAAWAAGRIAREAFGSRRR
ncbi:MAG TPA: hypothetical protein VE007_02990 [Thermoanaerobaculia bacterium]|nr:hypothetical protein [Thermoanaerobaculia bacterium]